MKRSETTTPAPYAWLRSLIIALTACALKDDAQRSLDAGCRAHRSKPIKTPTLLAAIAEYARQETKAANP